MNELLRTMKSLLLGSFVAIALAGCANVPTPNPIALAPVDPETASTLQLYRPSNGQVGKVLDDEVYVDGVSIGLLPSLSNLTTKVAPGTHEIVVLPRMKIIGTPTEKSYKLTITVGAKETKYVRFNKAIGRITFYGTTAVANDLTSLTEVTGEDFRLLR